MSQTQQSPSDAELIAAAIAAREQAYAPYSNFLVGAAVSTSDGAIFCGCNVENASYGLAICAERVTLATAVAAGRRHFAALAVASSGGLPPCGACRQFAAEFGDLRVLLIDTDAPQQIVEHRLADLLPHAFHLGGPR